MAAISQAVASAVQAAMSKMPGLRTRAESVNKNPVEILLKRVDTFEIDNYQDWKFRFEMALRSIHEIHEWE